MAKKTRKNSLVVSGIIIGGALIWFCNSLLRVGEINIVAIVVILLTVLCIAMERGGRKILAIEAYRTNKLLQDPITYNFYETYFTIKTENETSNIPYVKLYNIQITPKYVYLLLGKHLAYILEYKDEGFKEFIERVKMDNKL